MSGQRQGVVELATLLGNVHMALGARVDETIPEAAARVVRERDEAVRRVETYKTAALDRASVARLTAAARRAVAAWNGGEGLTTEDFDALEAALVELGAATEDVEAAGHA